MKRKNKQRLYIAYYLRPKHPDVPHQALMVGPKTIRADSPFAKFHVKNTLQILSGEAIQPWVYKTAEISDVQSENRLLALACIGKLVAPMSTVRKNLESVPIYQAGDSNQKEARDFNCVSWVTEAINTLTTQGCMSQSALDLGSEKTQGRILQFVKEYGRWGSAWKDEGTIPVLDLLSTI